MESKNLFMVSIFVASKSADLASYPKSIRFLHRAAKTFLSRPFTYTVEPDSAIPFAIAHPIPLVEPVIKAVPVHQVETLKHFYSICSLFYDTC